MLPRAVAVRLGAPPMTAKCKKKMAGSRTVRNTVWSRARR